MHATPTRLVPTFALIAFALLLPSRSQAASILIPETDNADSAGRVKLPFDYGIDVQFHYANWTDSGNKGFSLGFFNPADLPTTASGEIDTTDLSKAFLAISIDSSGNYVQSGDNGGDGKPSSEAVKALATPDLNSKEDSNSKGDELAQAAKTEDGGDASKSTDGNNSGESESKSGDGKNSYRKAEIEVDSSRLSERTLPVTVWITTEDGSRSVVAKYDAYKQVLDYCGGDARKIPDSLSLALGGSTSSVTSVQVTSLQNAPGFSSAEAPEPASLGTALVGILLVGLAGMRQRRQACPSK